MDLHERYSIIGTIGSGDFAVVYRARDLELGREVAIKQIHPQFLSDKQKLDSYWREAELLANLEHPSIMTIYDLVRSQGWLILELMQGNLKDRTEGKPINVEYLRLAMFHCLHALKFLHENRIIHGDVKPANMLIDKRSRVKLGDFGLARRVSNDEGSLLKGTTKYMAPEVFSDQFGPVTPASDLYSLGFSAYELLCGDRFEDLFPGLNAFGRDRQLAWIMWHAAADRRLPEIHRVMEGVPEDLQHVIAKLIEKDPKKRYRSADEALADLVHQQAPKQDHDDEAAALAAAQQRRKRRLAIVAVAVSMALSIGALFIPTGQSNTQTIEPMQPVQGLVKQMDLNQRTLVVATADGKFTDIKIASDAEIHLNDRRVLLGELHPGDQLVAHEEVRDGQLVLVVAAARPNADVGSIKSIQSSLDKLTVTIEEGPDRGAVLELSLGHPAAIYLNGEPADFADLKAGDHIQLTHTKHPTLGRMATEIRSVRVVELGPGEIQAIDPKAGQVVLTIEGRERPLSLPVAKGARVTLNNLSVLDGNRVSVTDLKAGDRVRKLEADTELRSIDAYRTFTLEGKLADVRPGNGTIDIIPVGAIATATVQVPPNTPLTLGKEPVSLAELQIGDRVELIHDSPDQSSLRALELKATRPSDPNRWGLVIGVQRYDDRHLAMVENGTSGDDARRVHQTLVNRYRVPTDQAMLLEDTSRIRLEQEIDGFLARLAAAEPPAGQLVVYFAGHAFLDEDGNAYLAPTDFALSRRAATGVPLAWLIEKLNTASARDKLLLLDTCHELPEDLLAAQPSTAEVIKQFKEKAGRGSTGNLTIVASCAPGQRGHRVGSQGPGVFAETLQQAFSGKADQNRDNRLNSAELFEFAEANMSKFVSAENEIQRPVLFPPDVVQAVFSDEAKAPILQLLAMANLPQREIDTAEARSLGKSAESLAGGEPDGKLAFALVLLKASQLSDALRQFEELKVSHPNLIVVRQAAAFLQFRIGRQVSGIDDLGAMLALVPEPKAGAQPEPRDVQLFEWSGKLRAFTELQFDGRNNAALDAAVLKLDQLVGKRSEPFRQAYAAGRTAVQQQFQKYSKEIADARDEATKSRLRTDQRQLLNYVDFDLSAAVNELRAGLDRLR